LGNRGRLGEHGWHRLGSLPAACRAAVPGHRWLLFSPAPVAGRPWRAAASGRLLGVARQAADRPRVVPAFGL